MSTTNLVDDDVDSDAGSSSSRSFLTDSDDNVASSSEEETTLRTTGSQLRGVAADLNLDSDSEDEDEPYEQQPDAEDRRWKSALAARTRALENRLAEERNLQDRRPQEPDTIGPRGTRAQIKVACGLLRVRQMLLNSDWAVVASGLQVIAAEVPRAEAFQRPSASTEPAQAKNSFGVYTPILARLACDVHDALEREGSSREARRTEMTKGSAKALVALRQRWLAIMAPGSSSLTSTRGGGKDSKEREWVGTVRRLVAQNPPPECLGDPAFADLDDHLLTAIEQLVLPSALPHFSLAGIDLDDVKLAEWPSIRQIPEIMQWYLSFATPSAEQARQGASDILKQVKHLHLNGNRLSDLPVFLARLFPRLEGLSLACNAFTRIPPSVTLLPYLRRIRVYGNPLVPSYRALQRPGRLMTTKPSSTTPRSQRANTLRIQRFVRDKLLTTPAQGVLLPSEWPLRSLYSLSAEVAHAQIANETPSHVPALANVPPAIAEAVTSSYTCLSCSRFIVPSSPLFVPPFWERWHHLDPGMAIPLNGTVDYNLNRRARDRRTPPQSWLAEDRPPTLDQRIWLALSTRSKKAHQDCERTGVNATPTPVTRRRECGNGEVLWPESRRRRRQAHEERGHHDWSSGSEGSTGSEDEEWSRSRARRKAKNVTTTRASHQPPRRKDVDVQGVTVPPTLVIGGHGPLGLDFRFCTLCAAAHLGMETTLRDLTLAAFERGEKENGDRLARWTCRCWVCKEERRTRGDWETDDFDDPGLAERFAVMTSGGEHVLRWFRRKEELQPRPQ